ncbi:hypothetical protein L195_g026048 [Trifolium pratense]|uniref:Retrotransposon gag domain-containing protein n=1 Tax=Trifolium pratense TaxID=57577 RepID=A0A2K3NI86_TRIPR|nr:hypothetical protein L195_g026048 [Trifolium pratense]
MNFKQHDDETLREAYERINLLKRKFPNHSLDLMEFMQIFTGGMRIQHRMHLDASAGGSINVKTAEEKLPIKEIDLLKRKLEKAPLGDEVKKVHEICDFCHENHPNGYCVPEGIANEEYAKFMGRPSPYLG